MKSKFTYKVSLLIVVLVMFFSSVAFATEEEMELSIEQSVTLAIQNNPDIKTAIAQQAYYKGGLEGAKSALRPNVKFQQTSTNQTNDYTRMGSSPNNGFVSQLSLTQSIYSGGANEANIQAAKAQMNAYDWNLELAKQTLYFTTRKHYYEVLNTKEMVTVNQTSLNNLVEHLKNVQAQFDAGVVAKSDVLRSQVAVSNQQQVLIEAQNNYDTAVVALKTDMSMPLTNKIKLTTSQMDIQKSEATLEAAVQYALENRPEVQQAKYNIESAKAKQTAAKAGYLPSLSLSATDSSTGNQWPGSKDKDSRFGWSLGYGNAVSMQLVLSYNVFDGGLTDANIKQAKSALEQAEQALQKAKNIVAQDVTNAYVSLLASEKQINTTKLAVEQAQEDFHISQVRYSAGVGTNIDVLDAQNALQKASSNYVQAYANYNISRSFLDKAMGVPVGVTYHQSDKVEEKASA